MNFQVAAIALSITGVFSSAVMAGEPQPKIPGALPSGVMAAEREPEREPELELEPEQESDQQNAVEQQNGHHCVMDTIAVREGEPLPENVALAVPQCFQTFAEAISAATGGAVSVPPDTRPEDFNEQLLPDSQQPAALSPIATEYQHRNFGGASLTYRSNRSCRGYVHALRFVGSVFNDRISSARVYPASGCNNSWHYQHRDFGGARVNCHRACRYIGNAMNDRTSSIRWTR